MPELPEVETIVRSLGPHLAGRVVRAVAVRERRLRAPVGRDVARRLAGRPICAVARYGKALALELDGDEALLVQLGMTGRLTLRDAGAAPRPHDHVRFALDDGRALVFNDVRRFGWLRVVPRAAITTVLGGGADPLGATWTGAALYRGTRGRRTSIKAYLMDQRRVLGIGNIYANEILFHAGIRPRRRAGRLTRAACEEIVAAARRVLAAAIRCGGSSIADYRDGFDRPGTYQVRHRVYGRAGQPCRVCGAPIVGCRVVGRSTFYCRRCQR